MVMLNVEISNMLFAFIVDKVANELDPRSLQTMTWDVPQVFTKEWHKIHFGVFRDKVVLFVKKSQK